MSDPGQSWLLKFYMPCQQNKLRDMNGISCTACEKCALDFYHELLQAQI